MKTRAVIYTVIFAAAVTLALSQPDLLRAQSSRNPANIGNIPGSSSLPGSSLPGSSLAGSPFRHFSSIDGIVQGIDGKPLKDVRVDLHDISNGTVIASAYSAAPGSFAFNSVPDGTYEVVAVSGTSQANQRITVASFNSNVTLRLPNSDVPHDGAGHSSISVAQYKVPAKAREELMKSQEAARRSKPEDAAKHLARALEIDPDFSDALTVRAVGLFPTDLAAAVADLEHAVKSDGNNSLALTVLGAAKNAQAKFDEALLYLQRSETLAPDCWQTYFELAKTHIGKSDFAASLRNLDKTMSMIAEDYSPIHMLRGRALFGMHRYAEATGELDAYLQKEPHGPAAGAARDLRDRAQQLLAKN